MPPASPYDAGMAPSLVGATGTPSSAPVSTLSVIWPFTGVGNASVDSDSDSERSSFMVFLSEGAGGRYAVQVGLVPGSAFVVAVERGHVLDRLAVGRRLAGADLGRERHAAPLLERDVVGRLAGVHVRPHCGVDGTAAPGRGGHAAGRGALLQVGVGRFTVGRGGLGLAAAAQVRHSGFHGWACTRSARAGRAVARP